MDWEIWLFIIVVFIANVAITALKEKKKHGKDETAPEKEPAQAGPVRDAPPKPETESHKVAGVTHHLEAFYALRVENDDYRRSKRELVEEGMIGERIWQYEFFPVEVELVPEPENPYDPEAIKVEVDGHCIGYIKKGSCAHVHKLLKTDSIKSITAEMGGGKYKRICEDYDENGNGVYTSETESIPHYAKITITKK